MDRLAEAVMRALDTVPSVLLEQLADELQYGRPLGIHSGITDVKAAASRVPGPEAAAFIRGALAAHRRARERLRVEVVWGGPTTNAAPVRSTARVLIGLINEARRELVLTTYSARPYQPVIDALIAARGRRVSVDIMLETLDGAGTALSGAEPAAAFRDVPGARLWHWPSKNRPRPQAKLHAKLAIADRSVLLVSSVNLTESGVAHNIEAGIIVRGGEAPHRFATHLTHLCTNGTLARLN